MNKIINIFTKIIMGPGMSADEREINYLADYKLKNEVKAVWNDLKGPSYGIERIIKLFLVLVKYVYPTVLINLIIKKLTPSWQKLSFDIYLCLKFFWLLMVLLMGWYENLLVVCFTIYLISETVIYILNIIIFKKADKFPISFSRSMIFLMFNYIQVVFCFAIVYLKWDLINASLTPLSALYYSLATMTTVGYGEYYPQPGAGQVVVIIQMINLAFFVMVFINYFSRSIKHSNTESS